MAGLRIIDVQDASSFGLLPPCADPRFDHRTCDYWEDADRGSRAARPAWLSPSIAAPRARPQAPSHNPFAPSDATADRRGDALAALLGDGETGSSDHASADTTTDDDAPWNPFAPVERQATPVAGQPRKLALLSRGERVFGSYARVAIEADQAVAYAQFGPLSAYPRAQRLRGLYPQLPAAPLPAVITCVATTAEARGKGHGRDLVEDVCDELARRGFSAIEVYPDLTESPDATSAASPAFWTTCGFTLVVPDERYPVLRRELG